MQEVPVTADLLADEAQAPVIRMINALLLQALKERASDIHFEPYENALRSCASASTACCAT